MTPLTQSRRVRALELAGRYGILALLIVLVVLFSIAEPDSFATRDNYRAILNNQTIVVLLSLAAIVPLIVGEFDLSVAASLTIGQVLAVGLCANQELSPAIACALALLACLAIGIANGIAVVVLKVPAFVATLAIGNIAGGLAIWYSGGQTIFSGVPDSLTRIARTEWLGFPLPIWYTAAVAVVMAVLLGGSVLGRRMYAAGGNRRAAELSGIDARRYVLGAFVASAVLAGLSGVILGARLGSASPATGGSLLLPAFAGAFLGATTVHPGRFNVLGTVIAVYTLSVAVSGLQQIGAPSWFETVFNGCALVVAVALSGWALRSRVARAKAERVAALERAEVGRISLSDPFPGTVESRGATAPAEQSSP